MLVVAIGCGSNARTAAPPRPAAIPRATGALLVAHPGPGAIASAVPGAPEWIVRGRVRMRLDADGGVTRAGEVTHAPSRSSLAVPAWLGGGVALLGDDGVTIAEASGKSRAIAKGAFASISIGARELWLRKRDVVGAPAEWVRLDPTTGASAIVAPPIAAPIADTFDAAFGGGAVRPTSLSSSSAGPEFASPELGVALVDLLGPIRTRDGGATWSPFEPDAVRALFGAAGPARVVRDGASLLLASDERTVPILPSGQLGEPSPVPNGAPTIPDAAAVRPELVTTHGVPLGEREVLVTDGPRLAVVEVDPTRALRVVRATKLDDVVRCELHPSRGALAVAACARTDANAVGNLAIGTVTRGDFGPRLSVERTFSFGTGHRATSTGAVAVSSSCAGLPEGGLDLLTTTKACVRDAAGAYREIAIPASLSERRVVVPTAWGGVLIVREDVKLGVELVLVGAGGTIVRRMVSPASSAPRPQLVSIDEVEPGRFVAWRTSGNELHTLDVTLDEKSIRSVEQKLRAILDEQAVVGAFGERALIAKHVLGEPRNPARVEASVTTDRGKTWSTEAWADDAPALDLSGAGRQVECGAVGCRAFGWSRIGWQPTIAWRDEVIDPSRAPEPTPPAIAPPGYARLTATCSTVGASKTVPRADVPSHTLVPPVSSTVGAFTTTSFGFAHSGTVRGGIAVTGPKIAPWGEAATAIVRWSGDLDPIDAVHESAPFPWPFPGRAGATVRAIVLAPSRVLLTLCTAGRCELLRVAAGRSPEPIDLGAAVQTITHVESAGELGGVLALVGRGATRAVSGALEAASFVALVDADGPKVSFLSRGRDRALGIDAAHGTFALVTSSDLPVFAGGSTYVLPIGPDARPAGAFETLDAPSTTITRPTTGCTTAYGWQVLELPRPGVNVDVAVDGAKPISIEGGWSSVVRHRKGTPKPCLDRVTYVASKAAFQLDPVTSRAVLYAVDDDGKTATRRELACTLSWR